jgi:Xaa-Pro aminopeptidase
VATLGFDEVRDASDQGRLTRGLELARAGDVSEALAAMRLRKDATEVALLRRAIDITATALCEAMRSAEPGLAEFQLEALIEYVFRREGAVRSGFPSIVGSGPNSCVLHYSRNGRLMKAGDLVVCDVGAEFGRYSADVTRTFPVSGRFTDEQRKVYEAVLAAQEAGFRAVRPGATVRDVHLAAYRSLAEKGYAEHFPHGTSHWLGLDVHDVGDYDTPLEPGMVLTVEPGVYLGSKELGVRIEDVVLVTEDGCELLSVGVPRGVAEIEALMREKGIGNEAPRPYPARKRREIKVF